MNQVENTPRALLEEKLTIPARIWINSIGLVFLAVVFTVSRPHWILYVVTLLITFAQIKYLINYYHTGYRLTTVGLEIIGRGGVVDTIPYNHMVAVKEGHFRELIKLPEVRQLKGHQDIVAFPKLGGVKILTLLLYKQGEQNKALFFQPSLTMRMFIEDRIREQVA